MDKLEFTYEDLIFFLEIKIYERKAKNCRQEELKTVVLIQYRDLQYLSLYITLNVMLIIVN